MSSSPAWKSLLGFTERFAAIDQIASSLKLDPEVKQPQALKFAQAIETECFNSACSEKDYIRAWKAKLEEIKTRQPPSKNGTSPPFSPATPQNGCSSPSHSGPGITLGTYTSCHHIASGLFSAIYKALAAAHLSTRGASVSPPPNFVALKLTSPSVMIPPHDSRREARILAALGEHKHITPLLETFTQPPSNFVLVFPFLRYNLAELLSARHRPTERQLVVILGDIANALKWTHSHGILHRDVKPSNILLECAEGPVYLGDFGIAWSPTDASSEPAEDKITDVGTTCYRPPELLFGYKAYGTGLDMWAFGCTVAECFMTYSSPDVGEELVTTFFDAGDLGSELRLVASIFQKLGTPCVETWPEAANFPDFGKILFHQFPVKSWEELLPDASAVVRDLVNKLLVYESGERLSAEEVLEHEVFKN